MAVKTKPQVGIVMGSDSDWALVRKAAETLDGFGVGAEVRVLSAHRTPDEAAAFARGAARRGLKVIIAAAGGAAHLAGVLAAHTTLPVVGIPVKGGALNGVDALLAMVQMPAGIPVATVTLGSAGPENAALLAVQMLALSQPALAAKLQRHKLTLKKKVKRGNAAVQADLAAGRKG
ncbi:MAG: 5-(carboxyamino)imidazole ribonucleotide mutase [Lentisphaerae bacterium]|nr:5-(carboxyamino)imidazole ribonucleotide mutase [Lentisphaerota bacterium]